MNTEEYNFELPAFIEEMWQKTSLDFFVFIFKQAEKRLTVTIQTAELITQRALVLLGLSVSILTVVLGFLSSQRKTSDPQPIFVIAAFIEIIGLAFVFFNLYKCLKPYRIEVPGSEPKFLLNSGFVDGFDELEQLKSIYLSECKSYQERINHNHSVNERRRTKLYNALKLLAASPLSFVLSGLAVEIFPLLQSF